jgi:hypothetical protein
MDPLLGIPVVFGVIKIFFGIVVNRVFKMPNKILAFVGNFMVY